MKIKSNNICETLRDKKVDYIFHANSVLTACQFLREGALLSRGTVKQMGLPQTSQYSDGIDKNRSIWFDVFLDSVDIHARAKSANMYGPVLFKIRTELLEEVYTGGIWVTKDNPTNWAGAAEENRWFQSSKELREGFVKGAFGQMIVLRHCGGRLDLNNYLEEIIIDDPQLTLTANSADFFSIAYGAVNLALREGPLDAKLLKRRCPHACKCVKQWQSEKANVNEMFLPIP